jgi:hypothetical protein
MKEMRFNQSGNELGLSRPFFGLHMSVDMLMRKNIEHSIYIHELIKNNFITH